MNPPYKNMKQFIKKAFDERNNCTTVCLIPARTNTKWWHDWCMQGDLIGVKSAVGALNRRLDPMARYIAHWEMKMAPWGCY